MIRVDPGSYLYHYKPYTNNIYIVLHFHKNICLRDIPTHIVYHIQYDFLSMLILFLEFSNTLEEHFLNL